MVTENTADCVIVGGGIGGAVLALALGQRGLHSVLLERELTPPGQARPEVLAQSTIETFRRLGAGERIVKEAAMPLQSLEMHRSGDGIVLHMAHEDFVRSGVQPYTTDPARTRAILLESAAAHGSVELHRGVEVQDVLRKNGRIAGVTAKRGEESLIWRAPLVVGDDGGKSRIRSAMGIPLSVKELPVDFLAAVGPSLPGHRDAVGEAWINLGEMRHGIAGGVFMPLPGNRTALVFLMSPAAITRFQNAPPAEFYAAAAKLSPRCEGLEKLHPFPKGFGHFRRPFGHAPRYVADGAAILGDAAHPVTPAGGQGANASVADAIALAEVAANAIKNKDCSAARLTEYEKLRRPGNTQSLLFSSRANIAFRTIRTLPFLAPVVPWILSQVENSPEEKQRFLRFISQAFATRPHQ